MLRQTKQTTSILRTAAASTTSASLRPAVSTVQNHINQTTQAASIGTSAPTFEKNITDSVKETVRGIDLKAGQVAARGLEKVQVATDTVKQTVESVTGKAAHETKNKAEGIAQETERSTENVSSGASGTASEKLGEAKGTVEEVKGKAKGIA